MKKIEKMKAQKFNLAIMAIVFACFWLTPFHLFAQKPDLIVPTGHSGTVSSLKFTPDGKYLISGCYDRSIKMWDVATGSEIRTFSGHIDCVSSIDISADGKYLVSAANKDNLKLWDLYTGKELMNFTGHVFDVKCVVFSPDGKRIASAAWDQSACIWDVKTGKAIYNIIPSDGYNYAISFSPDGNQIIFGGEKGVIHVCDAATGNEINKLKGHKSSIYSLSFSKDGSKILSTSYDKTIIVWNAKNGKKIQKLVGHTNYSNNACFSPDGKKVISGSADLSIKIWDIESGKTLKTLTGHTESIWSVAVLPDGSKIASGGWDKTIKLWDLETGNQLMTFKGICTTISSVSISSDEKMIVANGGNNSVNIWQTDNYDIIQTLFGHTQPVNSVAFSADHTQIVSGGQDGTIILWDVATGQLIRKIVSQSSEINKVSFSPNGSKILSCSQSMLDEIPVMKLWDINTGREIFTIKGYSFYLNSVAFSSDGKMMMFATGTLSGNAEIRLYDTESGQNIKILTGLEYEIEEAAFSYDNKFVAAAGWDKEIAIWNVETGKMIKTIAQNNTITRVAFSPDNNSIISACGNTLYLFDIKSGRELRKFEGHTSLITSIAFTPKGNKIISSSWDGKVKLWDALTGKEIVSLIAFDKDNWAVVSPNGLFDASPNFLKLVHFIQGNEIIELEQLKSLYYEPFLFRKTLGDNTETLRKVKDMSSVKLYPEVEVSDIVDGKFKLKITNKGGGIGRVVVFLNAKEIIYDARPQNFNVNMDSCTIKISIANNPNLIAGKQNKLEVKVYNKDEDIISRGVSKSYYISQNKGLDEEPPSIYIVSIGINDYDGEDLDLKFAAKDAKDIAFSLKMGAIELFAKAQTHVYLLTAPVLDKKEQDIFAADTFLLPKRQNILNTLKAISKKAKTNDLLILYMAGHGAVLGDNKQDFYYITQEANSADNIYNDETIRNTCTLSSDSLVSVLKTISAQKQVLIIDACHSGKVAEKLMSSRDLNSNAVRAIDRMKDRMGMHILAGSNANQVSYESSRFGQGLLTYSLLEGLKGTALREEKFIDINTLFQSARERVPVLAIGIGGVQTPVVFSPLGSESFDIGIMTDQTKQDVPLAKSKPVFIKSQFFESESLSDIIDLDKKMTTKMEEFNSQGRYAPIIFIESSEFPGSYYFRGMYSLKGNVIKLKANLFKDKDLIQTFELNGQKQNTQLIINNLVDNMMQAVK